MSEPKRANDHAKLLRMMHQPSLDAAAAEIERLAARVAEVEGDELPVIKSAKLVPGYAMTNPPKLLGYEVQIEGVTVAVVTPEDMPDRRWLPIESAPRDGKRVELWLPEASKGAGVEIREAHATHGYWVGCADPFFSHDTGPTVSAYQRMRQPTHWRPEPEGPKEN